MVVTQLEQTDKKRFQVSIDGSFSFWFYQKDYRKYDVLKAFQTGMEVQEGLLDEVVQKLLLPRAKETALCFLEKSDRSEQEIRKKLKDKQFPDILFDEVISYLREYHYLDEERLVRTYLSTNTATKSRRFIRMKLKEKGISYELISGIMQEEEYQKDTTAVCRALEKKLKGRQIRELTWDDQQKIKAHLYRKGFTGTEIEYAWQKELKSGPKRK